MRSARNKNPDAVSPIAARVAGCVRPPTPQTSSTRRHPAIGLFSIPSKIGSLESLRKGGALLSRQSNGALTLKESVNQAREARGIQISAYSDEQKEEDRAHNFCWSSDQDGQAYQGAKRPESEDSEPANHWSIPPVAALLSRVKRVGAGDPVGKGEMMAISDYVETVAQMSHD